MSLFGEDDKVRKMLVVFDYITRYGPKALREITKVAVANNVRYNPGRAPNDINWARDKSKDQLGSLFRHMMERRVDGKIFEEVDPKIAEVVGFDRVYVMAEAAWRAIAQLELDIEAWETAMAAQEALEDHAEGVALANPKSLDESVNDAIDRLAGRGVASKPCSCCGAEEGEIHSTRCIRYQL